MFLFVDQGDVVNINDPILRIAGEAAVLRKESASIEQRFAAEKSLQTEVLKALSMEMAKIRMDNDSLLLKRQKDLWKNFSRTLNDLEQRQINNKNSTINYESLVLKYRELKRQLRFDADQAAKNLQMKCAIAAEYLIRSKIKAKVYDLLKGQGGDHDLTECAGIADPQELCGRRQICNPGQTGKRTIRTGLKDYQQIQVLSVLTAGEEIFKPAL